MLVYTIPASSSSGWSTSDGNAKNVLYNNDTTNGAYYTWCTATAGTCLQGTDEEVKGKDAPASICPRGWKLPSIAEYETFLKAASIKFTSYWQSSSGTAVNGTYTGSTLNGAYSFPYAGRVNNGSFSEVSAWGYYWSSTAYNSDRAYYLLFGSSNVSTVSSYPRYLGFSVRCIAL